MSNLEKYIEAFVNSLEISKDQVNENLSYQGVENWDSVGHMSLIGELEDTFDQIADYTYSMDKGWNDMQYSVIIGFIGQLLGYYIAESKDLDADSPRHLTQAIVLK